MSSPAKAGGSNNFLLHPPEKEPAPAISCCAPSEKGAAQAISCCAVRKIWPFQSQIGFPCSILASDETS